MSVNVHVMDDDDRGERWLIIVEMPNRSMATFEARVPKTATGLDVQAFLAAVMKAWRNHSRGRKPP